MSPVCSALCGTKNERVALTDMSVQATLHDLLSEVTVRQTYHNLESVNIEAVYTFPLPLDAQLLNLEVTLAERVLQGVVTERHEAEQRYEDAVADGNAAVMLEMLEPGIYTMNVGNILPNESATVSVTYALLYRWSGDRLRVFIPTVIADRYGPSRFQPHQATESSMAVENAFSLQLEVRGALRDARFSSPSHSVSLATDATRTLISLRAERAVMDRDFVLEVTAPRAVRSFAMTGQDGEGVAAIASFQPFFSGLMQPRAISLGVIIDCSGSMQGMSIQQAKRALDDILRQLGPNDQVSIVAFGTHVVRFGDRLASCTEQTIARARAFVQSLDANMGGTEVASALAASLQTLGNAPNADVFLVTDGQVSDWANVVERARGTRHRFFTVGVGTAVAEAFVRELAARTGGACELVSPNEGMSDRVVRHFERIRAPRAKRGVVRWPAGATSVYPTHLESVFEGDTILASAQFERGEVAGDVVLELETEDGTPARFAIPISATRRSGATEERSTIARVAAAMRLETLDASAARATALRYRLTSQYTNWLVVAEREERDKNLQLPALRKVPQVQVYGMGGMVPLASPAPAAMPTFSKELSRARVEERSSRITGQFDASYLHRSSPVVSQSASAASFDRGAGASRGEDGDQRLLRLVTLINSDPDRVSPSHACDLLLESGFSSLVHRLRELTGALDIDPGKGASMALVQLLHWRVAAERLTPNARGALARLESELSDDLAKLSAEARSPSLVQRVVHRVLHGAARDNGDTAVSHTARKEPLSAFVSLVSDRNLWRRVTTG